MAVLIKPRTIAFTVTPAPRRFFCHRFRSCQSHLLYLQHNFMTGIACYTNNECHVTMILPYFVSSLGVLLVSHAVKGTFRGYRNCSIKFFFNSNCINRLSLVIPCICLPKYQLCQKVILFGTISRNLPFLETSST